MEKKKICWGKKNITVKKTIGLTEMLSFVDNVVNGCFEKESGAYMPEVFTFAVYKGLIDYWTDYKLPSDVQKMFDLLFGTDLVEKVLCEVDETQYKGAVDSAKEKCRHLADMLIDGISERVEEMLNGIKELVSLAESAGEMINSESVEKIAQAVGEFGIDEAKVVKAVFDERAGRSEE